MVRKFLLFFLSAVATLHAGQGVILKQSVEEIKSAKKTTTTSYVEADRVTIDSEGDTRMTVVYLAEGNTMRMIDHSKKVVREMSGDDLEKMMGQANEATAKMQEQLKNMPPQQRAMMEKMMGDRMKGMMGGEAEKLVFKRGDGSAEVGGRSCDWYEGYKGEALSSMVCAADWSALEVRASDFAVLQRMANFLTKLAPGMADMARVGGDDWQERRMFPGVPLEQTIYANGKPQTRSRMEAFERGAIDGAVFEAPKEYKVEKGMPGR